MKAAAIGMLIAAMMPGAAYGQGEAEPAEAAAMCQNIRNAKFCYESMQQPEHTYCESWNRFFRQWQQNCQIKVPGQKPDTEQKPPVTEKPPVAEQPPATETPGNTQKPPAAEKPPVTEEKPGSVQKPQGTAAYARQILELVNEERKAAGLESLTLASKLSDVAQVKAEDMRDQGYFSHTSPTYGSPFDMMKQFGIVYRAAGENIAKGYTSPQAVMKGWMNSSGHRENILNGKFTQLGVGYCTDSKGNGYWVQMFIKP